MQERQDILESSIGYLEKEKEALDNGYQLLIGSLMLVLMGTGFEALFFWLYNGSCHPFANILQCENDQGKYKYI